MPARRRKGSDTKKPQAGEALSSSSSSSSYNKEDKPLDDNNNNNNKQNVVVKKWSCIDSCCWFIGFICCFWWWLLFLYNAMPASFPQYVTEAITGPSAHPPGLKLHKLGFTAKHPVVFVPGIVTGGLELWQGHQCAHDLFRLRLWGGTFGDVYKRSFHLTSFHASSCLYYVYLPFFVFWPCCSMLTSIASFPSHLLISM